MTNPNQLQTEWRVGDKLTENHIRTVRIEQAAKFAAQQQLQALIESELNVRTQLNLQAQDLASAQERIKHLEHILTQTAEAEAAKPTA